MERARISLALTVAFALAPSGPLLGESALDPLLASLDQFCVLTKINDDLLQQNLKMYETIEVTGGDLQASAPGSRLGFFVLLEKAPVLVTIGEIQGLDGEVSQFCSVAAEGYSFDAAKELVEANFNVALIEEARQGTSEFATYRSILMGYPGPMVLSVQSSQGMSTLSLYDGFGSLGD